MHKADVEVIGAQFAAETVEIGAGCSWITGPSFCEYSDFVALHVFERLSDVRMASIGIGGVEETEAAIVSVEKEIRETLDAERGLIGMMTRAYGACAHGEAAGLDACAAESDGISGGEF